MKKILALLLMITVITGMLAGCGKKGGSETGDEGLNGDNNGGIGEVTVLPEGLSGIDAAKLILANERLNSQLFKDTDSLFASGATAFANLYDIAEQNMKIHTAPEDNIELLNSGSTAKSYARPLSASYTSSAEFIADESYELSNGSILEIDGNVYRWKNFGEYSNSYDYFLNITNNVKTTAEIGARLIDDTKKYVRIVDTWVKIGSEEYYLHVEDDTEIIYCRSESYSEICRRYKREDGVNVYEIYNKNSNGGTTRMVYIPGEKYEYSYIIDGFDHNFLAENTKGFWEVVDVGKTDWGYNVSCMVLKDDICYDSFYDPETKEISMLKVISSDKKTDIIDIRMNDLSAFVMLKLQGFSGVDYIELITDNVVPLGAENYDYDKYVYVYDVPANPKQEEHRVYMPGTNDCTLVLKNGLSIGTEDDILDGKIDIHAIRVEHASMEGYTDGYAGYISMGVEGKTYDEVMNTLEEFLLLTGLRCNRDFEAVKSGIIQAYTELGQMTKYHTWNESPIATLESLGVGYANNLAKHKSFSDMFDAIKDAQVIDFEDKEAVALNIKFAPITAQNATSVKNDGLSVSVTELSLSVEDTLLFVVGEKYMVNFAIVEVSENSNSGLNHVELYESLSVEYTDEEVFKVSQSASFEIPVLAEGKYTVVAYISTEDGIRSSGYQSVAFTEVNKYEKAHGNLNVLIDKGTDGTLSISVAEISEVEVAVEFPSETVPSYTDMFLALEKEAYLYGFVDEGALLEKSEDGVTWVSLTGNETSLEGGIYRLNYSVKNGNDASVGFVYTVYNPAEPTPS